MADRPADMLDAVLASNGDAGLMPSQAELRKHDDAMMDALLEALDEHTLPGHVFVALRRGVTNGGIGLRVHSCGAEAGAADLLAFCPELVLLVPDGADADGLRAAVDALEGAPPESPLAAEFLAWLRVMCPWPVVFKGVWLGGLAFWYAEGPVWSFWIKGGCRHPERKLHG